MRDLEDQVDRLTLVCRAMWEVLKERNAVSDVELVEMVKKVDLLDGQLDGKCKQGKQCLSCHRVMNRRHSKCIYCGAEKVTETVFDGI